MPLPFPLSMVGRGAGGALSIISTAYASGVSCLWSCPTLQATDVLLFCYANDGTAGSLTPTAGDDGGATLTYNLIGKVERQFANSVLYWARATGSETPGSVIEVFCSESDNTVTNGIMVQLRGCKTSGNPYEGWNSSNGISANNGPTATTITTGANELGLRFYCRSKNTASAPSSGWTEEREGLDATGGGNGITMALDSKLITAAGTEAATTRTVGGSIFPWTTHGLAMLAA
jgi:hypothetical protein